MKSKKEPTVRVNGLLTRVSSQRTPYKPYGYELSFDNGFSAVYVEVEVPEKSIISSTKEGDREYLTVDLNGLKAILKQTADAVDELEKEYKDKYK